MARLPRLAIDQQLHHLVHRAAPGVDLVGVDADRADYLSALLEVSREADVAIHAYAMLPDRIQLLLTPRSADELAPMMQRLGRRFVTGFNRRHLRNGSPWEGRYRTAVLQQSSYLIDAMRHVEMAPVACGLVGLAHDWLASSAAHHHGRRSDPLITEHPLYWKLGNTPFEREANYRQLGQTAPCAKIGAAIDDATVKGWVLGEPAFIDELAQKQARRLQPKRRGRVKRVAIDDSDPIKSK